MTIRDASESDVPGILTIYNQVIATSTAVYREDAATLDDRLQWFNARRAQAYPVLVASDDSSLLGFASYGDFRTWPGYRFSVEHTVHIREDQRGRGVGTTLMSGAVFLHTRCARRMWYGELTSRIDFQPRRSRISLTKETFSEVLRARGSISMRSGGMP